MLKFDSWQLLAWELLALCDKEAYSVTRIENSLLLFDQLRIYLTLSNSSFHSNFAGISNKSAVVTKQKMIEFPVIKRKFKSQ